MSGHKLPPGCTWRIIDGSGGRFMVAIMRGGSAIRASGLDPERGITTIVQIKSQMAKSLHDDITEALDVIGMSRAEHEQRERALAFVKGIAAKSHTNHQSHVAECRRMLGLDDGPRTKEHDVPPSVVAALGGGQ